MFLKGKGALASLKKKKDDENEQEEKDKKSDEKKEGALSAAALRLTSDMGEIEVPKNVKLSRKEDDPFHFSFVITPDQGHWNGASFEFSFVIPNSYPHAAPKVKCVDKIYHPNIDLEGNVCVNVLRPWKPTYTIQIILFGLIFLFSHPNPNDPLNKDAAQTMRDDPTKFKKNVDHSLLGGSVDSVQYTKNSGPGFVNKKAVSSSSYYNY